MSSRSFPILLSLLFALLAGPTSALTVNVAGGRYEATSDSLFSLLRMIEPVPAADGAASPTMPISLTISDFSVVLDEQSSLATYTDFTITVDRFDMLGTTILGISRSIDFSVAVDGRSFTIPGGTTNYAISNDMITLSSPQNTFFGSGGSAVVSTILGQSTFLSPDGEFRWLLRIPDLGASGSGMFTAIAGFNRSNNLSELLFGTDPLTGGPMTIRTHNVFGRALLDRPAVVPEPAVGSLLILGIGLSAWRASRCVHG